MKLAYSLLIAGAAAALSFAPADAHGGGHGSSSSGGHNTSSSSSSSSGGATSVPEPSDAVLLPMGVAGVVIGRKLHARKLRR
jgi:hypothetical protein